MSKKKMLAIIPAIIAIILFIYSSSEKVLLCGTWTMYQDGIKAEMKMSLAGEMTLTLTKKGQTYTRTGNWQVEEGRISFEENGTSFSEVYYLDEDILKIDEEGVYEGSERLSTTIRTIAVLLLIASVAILYFANKEKNEEVKIPSTPTPTPTPKPKDEVSDPNGFTRGGDL